MATRDFTKQDITDFVASPKFAFVGATGNTKKFGYTAFRELRKKGLRLVAVNPNYKEVDGVECYPSLTLIPERPSAVITMVPREQTLKIVTEAFQLGVRKIWIQQDSDSPEALEFCKTNGIKAIYGECILMHTEPVQSFHGFHRWLRRFLGKMPK